MDLKFEVEHLYKKYVQYPVIDIYYGLKNLWAWKGLIWTDRDWDYMYLIIMLKFKMKQMHKSQDSSTWKTVTADHHLQKLKICIEICERYIEDEYNSEGIDNHPIVGTNFSVKDPVAFRRELLKASKLKKRDVEMLFKYMERYLETWWD